MFFGNSSTETILTLFGAFVFGAYIIYDTHVIMKHLSAEEYIVAVINLYLDIINLFINILKLLNKMKQSQEDNKKKRRN
jgi:FtsH-binding integral membrane protein